MGLDWFIDWIERHEETVRRTDWPEAGSRFWDEHEVEFQRRNVREDVADRLTSILARNPPLRLDTHLKDCIAVLRRLAEAPKPARPEPTPGEEPWVVEVEAFWASLPEDARHEWRRFVLERLPNLRRLPRLAEALAQLWAHDPTRATRETPRARASTNPRRKDGPFPIGAILGGLKGDLSYGKGEESEASRGNPGG